MTFGYIYVLYSSTSGRYYVGSTNNPARRLAQHRSNAVAATRGKGPWNIVKVIQFPTSELAGKAEYYLKRQKSKKIIKLIVSDRFKWPELFASVAEVQVECPEIFVKSPPREAG